jgi:hypothetical protein
MRRRCLAKNREIRGFLPPFSALRKPILYHSTLITPNIHTVIPSVIIGQQAIKRLAVNSNQLDALEATQLFRPWTEITRVTLDFINIDTGLLFSSPFLGPHRLPQFPMSSLTALTSFYELAIQVIKVSHTTGYIQHGFEFSQASKR